MQIEGKAAIVTGASRGAGRATVLELARRGCNVVVNHRQSGEAAQQVVNEAAALGVEAVACQADVAQDGDCRQLVQAAVDAFGRIDVLVNNAGITRFIPHSDLEAVTDEIWQQIMGVNVLGTFQCIRAAAPWLKKEGGEVVNVSSIGGLGRPASSVPYCASKAAIINMTVTLARALGPEIRINAVAPGFIETHWLKDGLGSRYDAIKQHIVENSALGRVSQPADIADAIVGLICGSDMVTGQTIVVDGGHGIGASPDNVRGQTS